MDALFIIPTLISPEVDDRVVPAICKLVERNILLTRQATFRKAAIIRYLGKGKGLAKESLDVFDRLENLIALTEADNREDRKGRDSEEKRSPKKEPGKEKSAPARIGEKRRKSGASGSDLDPRANTSPDKMRPDEKEIPNGITFFSAVSLEPTYLEIVLKGRSSALSDEDVTRVIRIGMKAVPFKLNGVKDLKELLADSKSRTNAMTWYYKKKQRILSRWGWAKGSKPAKIIKKSLTSGELSNPKLLAKLMGTNAPREWAPLVIFSYLDFYDSELQDNVMSYNNMVKGGWGNMVIVDDDNQSLYFCTQETKACFQLTYSYLAKILDMENIIVNKGATTRSARPMSSSRQSSASIMSKFSEAGIRKVKLTNLLEELNSRSEGANND